MIKNYLLNKILQKMYLILNSHWKQIKLNLDSMWIVNFVSAISFEFDLTLVWVVV